MRIQTLKHIMLGGLMISVAACETTSREGPPSADSDDLGGVVVAEEIVVTGAPPPPPPPPPHAEPVMSEPLAMMGSTGLATERLERSSPMEMAVGEARSEKVRPDMPVPIEAEQPPVQSGLLTAGDYDDVLNPDLYKAYLDKVLQGSLGELDLPFVDANQRIEIQIIDRLGKAVPLAKISLRDADGKPVFPLRTGADGKAYLFPNYDELEPGMVVTASVDGSRPISQPLSDAVIETGGILTFDLSLDRAVPQKLDLLLTLDATGSMSDEMQYLQAELVAILDRVRSRQPDLDIRAGFIVYRDDGDDYVVREVAFSNDLDAFKTALGDQAAQGGGDMPEAMHEALGRGLDFEWRDDAVKINLLVADAPPHNRHIEASWKSGLISRSRGIHIVSLAASGIDDRAEFMMRALSQLTNARYLFLTDDSGVGLPHAEPTVDCYVVTRLDQLVERVVASLVTGQRVEPEGADVIRTVGDYRNGVCEVAPEPQTEDEVS
ncbi:MAG: VWA domain-containing protein [Pseudomonadota bacterium]